MKRGPGEDPLWRVMKEKAVDRAKKRGRDTFEEGEESVEWVPGQGELHRQLNWQQGERVAAKEEELRTKTKALDPKQDEVDKANVRFAKKDTELSKMLSKVDILKRELYICRMDGEAKEKQLNALEHTFEELQDKYGQEHQKTVAALKAKEEELSVAEVETANKSKQLVELEYKLKQQQEELAALKAREELLADKKQEMALKESTLEDWEIKLAKKDRKLAHSEQQLNLLISRNMSQVTGPRLGGRLIGQA